MPSSSCWICENKDLKLVKEKNFVSSLSSNDFKISDSRYGVTFSIYKCTNCTFNQCSDVDEDVINFYENLEDEEYLNSEPARFRQMESILSKLPNPKNKKLLDIGAGTGILVEAAKKHGYEAIGIEPSLQLSSYAKKRGRPVISGILPSEALKDKRFDVITIIDVVEHVDNPRNLIHLAVGLLEKNGVIVISTPNKDSIIAKILNHKWWHYRIAHIAYFNLSTLDLLMSGFGLTRLKKFSPNWYFDLSYFIARVIALFKKSKVTSKHSKFLKSKILKVNFFDSICCIYHFRDK